jgi:hypothetical protein
MAFSGNRAKAAIIAEALGASGFRVCSRSSGG